MAHKTRSLAIEGPARTGKTAVLVEQVVDLLRAYPSESILVLCSNYYRKSRFLEAIQSRVTGGFAQLQVTTYSALVRNTLALFWPAVETMIVSKPKLAGSPVIFPELSGFEASEYLMRKIVGEVRARRPDAFVQFAGSERSLITQLIRRARLRSENRLSRGEMRSRSERIGEACIGEVEEVLNLFDLWSSELRVLDNSRQIDVFHTLLDHNEQVRAYFEGRIRHLIVDDVDETVPAQQHFIKRIAPMTETLIIAADLQGGTRRGYLNAYPYDWEGLKALKPEMETIVLNREDPFYGAGTRLLKNWLSPDALEPLPVTREIHWRPLTLTRMEMIEQVVADVVRILQQDPDRTGGRTFTPGDIVVVMPKVDILAALSIQQQLKCRGIPLQILTGTQRPTDNPICRSLLLLLQLVNRTVWQMPVSVLEWKGILRHGLKLHHLDPAGTEALVQGYREVQASGKGLYLPPGDALNEAAQARYQILMDWLDNYRDEPIEEQMYSAFRDVMSPQLTADDELTDVHQMIRSIYIERIARILLNDTDPASSMAAREWLIQLKSGVVSDSPNKPRELDLEAVVLGTPQKIIDFEIERPIHLWLDVSSREWSRTDNAPLYNAWVHSVNWDGDTTQASDEFNQLLTRTRAAHITRTLMLYAGERVFLYSSELDDQGTPNSGIFQKVLQLPGAGEKPTVQRATLREDQAPVLTYPGGAMAVTAVPGAGKTFVNVEMLLELIERDVPPDSILVLTFMESAARTLLSRLKVKLGVVEGPLPVISTIHSLARRIITEDDHALYLGLDTEVELADELEVRDLIQPLLRMLDHGESYLSNTEMVIQGISMAKSRRLSPELLRRLCAEKGFMSPRLMQFIHLFEAYQFQLKQQGKMDFTDLIVYAIELLERFPEIRAKYQERFLYIIEDEAQDSSLLMQRFIELLQGESGNLIRTGDTNQSITTTFSTADTSVFRNFIAYCRESGMVVEMNQSARCAPEVMHLANRFIDWASADDILRYAFQPVNMEAVEGRNPDLIEPMRCMAFENTFAEERWILDKIKALQQANPDLSVAVLTRWNQDVLKLALALQADGTPAIALTDHPNVSPVFLLIVYLLRVLEDPADTEAMAQVLALHQEMGMIVLTEAEQEHYATVNLMGLGPEDIDNAALLQLYFNVQDLIRYAFGQDLCRLVVRLTDMIFTDPQSRSVGYLCALKVQEWVDRCVQSGILDLSPLEYVNQEFRRCLERKRLPFKMLQDVMAQPGLAGKRFVQVMTLHKSKGQEFDVVFIPGLSERQVPSQFQSVKWGDSDKLELDIERVQASDVMDIPARMEQKKLLKIEEEARLVYVGITRAKRGLFMTYARESKNQWGKMETLEPSRYFLALSNLVQPAPVQQPGLEVSPGA